MFNNYKRIAFILLGLLIMTAGLGFFIIPSKLASGGLTGFSLVLNHLFPSLSVGSIMLIGNIFLFILGFLLIGKQFGGYTIFSSLTLSAFLDIFARIFPMQSAPTDDLFINLFFGTLISSVGMAIVFHQDASTGGTDILAKIVTKYTTLDIGKALMVIDVFVVIMASMVFGVRLGLYALLGVLMNGFIIDNLIMGFKRRFLVVIMSEKNDEIYQFVDETLERGATLYHAEGAYERQDKYVLHTILNKSQYIQLKQHVHRIDPDALLSVTTVQEVFGEGFAELR